MDIFKFRNERTLNMEELFKQDNVEPKPVEGELRKLESILSKELRTLCDIATLEHYIKLKMVPQRLRWDLDIHEGDETYETKEFWSQFFNKCGLLLLETLVERKKKRLEIMTQEIKRAEMNLEIHKDKEVYKHLSGNIKNKLEKEELEIKKRKQRKFKRDSWDYKNNQLYSWQKQQVHETKKWGHEAQSGQGENPQSKYTGWDTGYQQLERNGKPVAIGNWPNHSYKDPQKLQGGVKEENTRFQMRGRQPKWKEQQGQRGNNSSQEWWDPPGKGGPQMEHQASPSSWRRGPNGVTNSQNTVWHRQRKDIREKEGEMNGRQWEKSGRQENRDREMVEDPRLEHAHKIQANTMMERSECKKRKLSGNEEKEVEQNTKKGQIRNRN